MSRENQIEEIAKIIFMYDSVNSTDEDIVRCANHLYNKGYRKQIEAEWIWADDGYCRCSNCTQKAPVVPQYQDEPTTTATKYCPKCGARMKGI